ncbi:hypothetical protein DSO57_1002144 [Entomophthora muscae]|uniref:Uncharacterized protein n=1 Tax=Entomophthora muscae TaxID=34485 RepID=A0ACC2SLP0_9FUNG|nr:hypothetical protein DSO57_1002144 [Entomophthora muscae]
MITLPLTNDEVLAYLLLRALLVLFLFLAVQLTRLYTASTANPQLTTNFFHTYYPNHGLKEWSELYKKANFPDVNQMLSRTQPLSHMPVSSHHQGYTILLPVSKEHKNDGSTYKVDDVHTRPHHPERISVEFKTKNRPRDSGSRARTSKKLQPQDYRPQKASVERPDGHKKKKKEHQESIGLVEPKASDRDQMSAKSFPGQANFLPKPENVVSK